MMSYCNTIHQDSRWFSAELYETIYQHSPLNMHGAQICIHHKNWGREWLQNLGRQMERSCQGTPGSWRSCQWGCRRCCRTRLGATPVGYNWHNCGVKPHSQVIIKVDGSRRMALRNRRFIRELLPTRWKPNQLADEVDTPMPWPQSQMTSRRSPEERPPSSTPVANHMTRPLPTPNTPRPARPWTRST